MSRYYMEAGKATRYRLTNTRIIATELCNLRGQLEDSFQAVQDDIDSGPDGAGPLVFNYTANAMWVVNHNLGRAVGVEILSMGGMKIGAEVQQVSLNQVRVYFDVPVPGRVLIH